MIKIDKNLCTGCGICTEICPAFVLAVADKKARISEPEGCLVCNQCVAVCPSHAVSNDSFPKKDYPSIKGSAISASGFENFTAARRSTRCFKPKAVPREILCRMIESAATAPTAKNFQELRYHIIDDPQQLRSISTFMMKKADGIRSWLSILKPFAYLLMGRRKTIKVLEYLDRLKKIELEDVKQKKDPFLRNAPAMIIIYSTRNKQLNYLDAGIAGYHLNLAALTHKLGTCWIGYHSVMSERSAGLRVLSGLDKKDRILATIAVGYPKFTYQSGCARRKPEISCNSK
jgi:nitroreductase/NAD-dependent dihydropyrimidine dehydrogenase PreA subunit